MTSFWVSSKVEKVQRSLAHTEGEGDHGDDCPEDQPRVAEVGVPEQRHPPVPAVAVVFLQRHAR